MYLSGFDKLLVEKNNDANFVYGGYSAGICILSPSLKGLELVDPSNKKVYSNNPETIWDGLGIVDYSFAPHYKSDHPESGDIDRVVDYFIKNKILFKALKDGDVIITE
jgi:dipeptidase E